MVTLAVLKCPWVNFNHRDDLGLVEGLALVRHWLNHLVPHFWESELKGMLVNISASLSQLL